VTVKTVNNKLLDSDFSRQREWLFVCESYKTGLEKLIIGVIDCSERPLRTWCDKQRI